MKVRSKVLIILVILIAIIVYFGYKLFNLYYYNVGNITEYQDWVDGIKIENTVTIQKKDGDYDLFEVNNIKIKDDFKNFEILENVSSEEIKKYTLYDENSKEKVSFWIGTTENYINLIKSNLDFYVNDENKINLENIDDFLETNNIQNDIDLFKFLEENKNVRNNIFTSVKQMKMNYTINFISFVIIPKLSSITLIDGDYTGYILNTSQNFKEVSILKDDKRYIFTFINLDYFDDDYINELLSTVEID
jgi:hypothetical protein